MTASSFLVPVAGLLTQPILAQALGVQGRGELAAAIAPSALALGIATLGLPDALTFFLAKRPSSTRIALLIAAVVTILLGFICFIGTYCAVPFLSVGSERLGQYILLAMAITIPALLVGVLRGAAMGRQMWMRVAVERALNSTLRVGVFLALLLLGQLTVVTAVVATVLIPAVCGLVYWRLLLIPRGVVDTDDAPTDPVHRAILSYGSKIWLGSVASVLLSRTDQLLMAPLSSIDDLGIYTVANTVSDVPFLVVTAVSGALIGVNSRSSRPDQVASTTRVTVLLGALGCGALALIVPYVMVPFFGSDFRVAVIPTIILILAAWIYAPGFVASAGLGAQGRPGLRSLGLCVTLVVNVAIFVLVVPAFGVTGACWTSVVSAVVFTTISVVSASRAMDTPLRDFLLIERADLATVRRLTSWPSSKRMS